jgi:RNA polymerase sigma-70 factor (ECF subfamily)
MDDDGLIGAVAAGDEGALRELFVRNAPWQAGRLRRSLPAHAVEDVHQETFVAVWRGARRYRSAGRPGAWLWTIANRQAALWLRRAGPTGTDLPDLDTSDERSDADPGQLATERVGLAAAVAHLGPPDSPDRELWRLLFVEDRPVAEVARLLRIPEGTVKSRAHRVRRLLRTALGEGRSDAPRT